MAAPTTLSDKVLAALVESQLMTAEQLENARATATAGDGATWDVVRERGLVSSDDVATVLEDQLGVPRVELSSYAPEDDALALVSPNLAHERRILPLFEIEGILTVVIADPEDVFKLDDVAAEVGAELEPVLADSASLLAGIVQYYGELGSPKPRETAPEEPAAVDEPEPGAVIPTDDEPAEAVPGVEDGAAVVIDLDVLAVANASRVGVLVSDIIDEAIRREATKIELLPYKDEFFLVFRIDGELEQVASAPLSLLGALVEGFKALAKVSTVPLSLPALGRIRARYRDRDVVLTVSAVPTVAGHRVVLSIEPAVAEPRSLEELGMDEAEIKALTGMVERGAGMLLVCGPVAGGRSATYYALLAMVAKAGRTAYSVERAVGFELPDVAQVLINPASGVGSAPYISAGLDQDTEVLAIDSIHTVDDAHLAIEATGRGRLVIATVAAGDIATGVRKLLDLGAEPNSLASALTFGVGQRLARTNCPNCSGEVRSSLTAELPGAPKGLVSVAGSGCPNCHKTGFGGVTGLFEVLAFSEDVRAVVARDSSATEIAGAAKGAGMSPMAHSGLVKVEAGLVSVEELDRVLRFSG
jgi:type IV pilus assembly protein PilB